MSTWDMRALERHQSECVVQRPPRSSMASIWSRSRGLESPCPEGWKLSSGEVRLVRRAAASHSPAGQHNGTSSTLHALRPRFSYLCIYSAYSSHPMSTSEAAGESISRESPPTEGVSQFEFCCPQPTMARYPRSAQPSFGIEVCGMMKTNRKIMACQQRSRSIPTQGRSFGHGLLSGDESITSRVHKDRKHRRLCTEGVTTTLCTCKVHS